MRRYRRGGKAVRAQRRKTLTRRKAPKSGRGRRSFAPDKETNVARLTRERDEALEQQTATSDVLKVISSSHGELEPVFKAMLENATRICDASYGVMFLREGKGFRTAATHNLPRAFAEERQQVAFFEPIAIDQLARLAKTKDRVHISDARTETAYKRRFAPFVAAVELGGVRTLLLTPLLRGGELVGVFAIFRQEVRPFTEKQIELTDNFAAQAVIAIENARLLSELRQRTNDLSESLQQQTATSDVLKVISKSPGELKPVFEAMLASAVRICDAKFGNLWLCEGNTFRVNAMYGAPPAYADFLQRNSVVHNVIPGTALGRIASERQAIQIPDAENEKAYAKGTPFYTGTIELARARTIVAVPLLKDEELVGAIVIFRQEVRPFTDKQIELVKNFAAQAVIAIENTRLLSELRESLEQQTATSEVLSVISSSAGELQPVFKTMLAKATELCEASYGTMWLREGDAFRAGAIHGALPDAFLQLHRTGTLYRAGPGAPAYDAITSGQPVAVDDLRETKGYRDDNELPVAA